MSQCWQCGNLGWVVQVSELILTKQCVVDSKCYNYRVCCCKKQIKKVKKVSAAIRAEEDAIVERQREWVRVRMEVDICFCLPL